MASAFKNRDIIEILFLKKLFFFLIPKKSRIIFENRKHGPFITFANSAEC